MQIGDTKEMLIVTMGTLMALNDNIVLHAKAYKHVGSSKFEVSYQTALMELRTHCV